MLAVGLIVVLVLGLIGVGWALYDPWGGAATGGGQPPSAPLVAASASPPSPVVLAPRHASRTRPTAAALPKHDAHSFARSTFAEYGVTLYYPRDWRELAASLVGQEVPYWNETLSQDQDVLAAYLPPSGAGAVIVFADHHPEPELGRFEFHLDGEVVLRELAGMGLPEVRLHEEKFAGRQALVSDTIVTPDMTMVAAIVVGRERLYYFAIAAKDEAALKEVRRGYWPALQHTEFTAVRPG